MAEIKIEKKSSNWLWFLLAFVVIAGIVAYFGLTKTDDDETQTAAIATTDTSSNSSGGPVAEYIQYINDNRTMGLDHNYTNEALMRLTAAIDAKAQQQGFNVSADLEKVKEHADRITQDPFETTHAGSIKKAADILTNALQNLQQSKYPDLSDGVTKVQTAANNINPDVLTLDQRDAVKSFFQESADLLQNMN